jgi:hypothetical protein
MTKWEKRHAIAFGPEHIHHHADAKQPVYVYLARLADFLSVPIERMQRYLCKTYTASEGRTSLCVVASDDLMLTWRDLEALLDVIPRRYRVRVRAIMKEMYVCDFSEDYALQFETSEDRDARLVREQRALQRRLKCADREYEQYKREQPEEHNAIMEALKRAFQWLDPVEPSAAPSRPHLVESTLS